MLLVAIGVGLGLGFAFGFAFLVSRLLTTFFFGISAVDPIAFGGTSGLLTVVAFLASVLPARRAMKIDPLIALRYE